jgi:chemotaxis protein methyltransferase CheR
MLKLTDMDHTRLSEYIKQYYGIDLQDKRTFIESRLAHDVMSKGYSSFTEFLNTVLTGGNKKDLEHMVNKLTTNHTYFMRENMHFEFLKAEILPYIEKKYTNREMRIWSAASSSGEEPYTIAMNIKDHLGMNHDLWDTRILATDLSSDVLKAAIRGVYKREAVESLPFNWIQNYFNRKSDGNYEVVNAVKDLVIFRKFNLMSADFPFKKKFHVIFCRNVMIYFDANDRKKLIQKFYKFLEPGGYLIIGHSETFPKEWANFEYVKTSIYRKAENAND